MALADQKAKRAAAEGSVKQAEIAAVAAYLLSLGTDDGAQAQASLGGHDGDR